MADLRIADAPEIALEDITGNEKVPTGGYGNSAVTINNLGQFAKTALSLATEQYVSNAVGQKENKITLTGINLTPSSTYSDIPQTNNSVLNTIHQYLLNRMEWIKDNVTVVTDHQALTNRNTFNTHPSTSISHNGTSNVSIEIEELKNDVLIINTETIPELSNTIIGKQDLIVNDINLTASSTLSPVPSTNNTALNSSLQALMNRDEFRSIHNNLSGRDVENAHPSSSIYDGSETQKTINDKTIQNVESVNLLRTFTPRFNGQVVYVKNHTSGTGKGGGYFIYNSTSTSTDDNGTIINSSSGGRFLRIYDSKIGYFEWFGAVCDGVADDTTAVISTLKVFKNVNFSGRLKLTQPIDLDLFKSGQTVGLTIEGNGTESSYLDFYGCSFGFYSSSNTFFRDLKLQNLQINNADGNKLGIGLYIGSAGSEQVNIESVTYRGWKIGRASHSWNSSYNNEVFRVCKNPFAMYGTSSNVNNPYAHTCDGPYLFGYQSSSSAVLSIPSVPHAYSFMSGFAADNCGSDGSIYKFGNCSGLSLDCPSAERCQGISVFDFSEILGTSYASVIVDNFTMYVNSLNPNITSLITKPNTPLGNVIFNNLKISTDKDLFIVTGDGSGVRLNNPQMNNRSFSRLVELPVVGVKINEKSIGQDSRENGEIGYSISANSQTYVRVKERKGKALIDPTTQKLVLYCGSLSEGLAQGNMMTSVITALPINKSGNNTNEKAGQLLISSAMDYNAGDMTGHLKVVRTGTLTTATTVTRNTSNTTVLQFDIIFEASVATTRYLLDIDLTFNGISNVNGLAWQIVSK